MNHRLYNMIKMHLCNAFSSTQSTLQYLPHSRTRIHTLMAETAMQGANCTSGAIWFSIVLKDTSTHSSVQSGGAGIQTSNVPITGWPALPTELQPPWRYYLTWLWCLNCRIFDINWITEWQAAALGSVTGEESEKNLGEASESVTMVTETEFKFCLFLKWKTQFPLFQTQQTQFAQMLLHETLWAQCKTTLHATLNTKAGLFN